MSGKKKTATSASEHTAELERIEHARRIVIDVLDKGILDLREVGYLAIDLSGLGRLVQDGVCGGCDGVCSPCYTVCDCKPSCPQTKVPGELVTEIKTGRK